MSSYKTDFKLNEKETLEYAEMWIKELDEIITNTIKTGTLDLNRNFNYLLIILQGCRRDVKEFNWSYDQKISQKDFIKVLSLMPNLTNLKLRRLKLEEEEEIEENRRKKLKLDLDICKNLKSLDVDDESFSNFFSLNFAQYRKLSLAYSAGYEQSINIKSPQAESIKKLDFVAFGKKLEAVEDILKFSNLEELKVWSMYYNDIFINVISKLKNLKVLKFQNCNFDYSVEDWKCLESLENLEKLSFDSSELDASFLGDLKLKSLRKLSLKWEGLEELEFVFENLSINSPNLQVLKVHASPHKINYYAKHFKNLEKLHLVFSSYSSSIEPDTGIINENLKEIKVRYFNFNDEVNDFFEIVEIFPNLESIEIGFHETDDPFFADKFLFAKLNKLKNLKSLKSGMPNSLFSINRCKDFIVNSELIDDLKSLSKKLKFYDFGFQVVSDKVVDYNNVHDYEGGYVFPVKEIEKENFQHFVSYLREFFEVESESNREIIHLRSN